MEFDIQFSIKNTFLPCYRHLLETRADVNLLWGGRDSGKSHFVAQKLIIDCLRDSYFRCVLIKKTQESIRDSQFATLKEIIEEWKLDHLFIYNESRMEIICKNGNRFLSRGCDKPGKLKSIRNPSHAWYEEGDQLTEVDFTTASTTLRGPEGIDVQEWISFNPECAGNYKEHWIYKRYYASNSGKMYSNFFGKVSVTLPKTGKQHIITFTSTHTTYQDNKYCPPSRQAKLEAYKTENPYYYKVYCLGEWGIRQVLSPFLFNFNPAKHVGKTHWNTDYITYLSFDFNKDPISCLVFQWYDHKFRGIEMIKLKNSDIDSLCQVIASRYPDALFIVCGDRSGYNRSALVKDDYNFFVAIQQNLHLEDAQIQVIRNPVIVENQVTMNRFLVNIDCLLDEENCSSLIFDCLFAEIRADGTLKKEDRDDPTQQLDALDCFRYGVNTIVVPDLN